MQKCQWEEQNKHEGMDSTTFGKRGHSEVYQRNSLSIFFTEEMQRVRGGERERVREGRLSGTYFRENFLAEGSCVAVFQPFPLQHCWRAASRAGPSCGRKKNADDLTMSACCA